eukprot:2135771-Rhodomonas_salina.4
MSLGTRTWWSNSAVRRRITIKLNRSTLKIDVGAVKMESARCRTDRPLRAPHRWTGPEPPTAQRQLEIKRLRKKEEIAGMARREEEERGWKVEEDAEEKSRMGGGGGGGWRRMGGGGGGVGWEEEA